MAPEPEQDQDASDMGGHGHADGRERRCIVTGEVRADAELIRFVAGPDDEVFPDIAGKLPGRGMWVTARRDVLEKAAAKNHFSRSAKRPLKVPPGLVDHTAALLVRRLADDMGLARRGGNLVVGFDQVVKALAAARPPALLIEAADGAADGRRKLLGVASAHGLNPKVLDCLNCQELSLALGRENVVHAALKSGQLAEKIAMNAGRLAGLRAPGRELHGQNGSKAGPMPAGERYE